MIDATYTISEKAENDKDSVIKKVYTKDTEFTISEVKSHMEKLTTMKKEMVAKRGVDNATAENVLHFNPEIELMTDEKLHAIFMYWQSKQSVKRLDTQVEEINKQLEKYQEEVEHIVTTLNLNV
jgi:DNA-binding transcriptional MerR regulator